MDVDQVFYAALSPLPCPVSQKPAGGTHETYVMFEETDGAYTGFASNNPQRIRHQVQVHIFSKKQDTTIRELQKQADALLKAAGIRVQRWKFVEYEKDTKYRHLAMTCEWMERLEE